VLHVGAAAGEQLVGRAKQLDGLVAAGEQAGRAPGYPNRPRTSEAFGDGALLVDEGLGLVDSAELVRSQCSLGSPRQDGGVHDPKRCVVSPGGEIGVERGRILAPGRCEPPAGHLAPRREEGRWIRLLPVDGAEHDVRLVLLVLFEQADTTQYAAEQR
jgi:hypothetical protein